MYVSIDPMYHLQNTHRIAWIQWFSFPSYGVNQSINQSTQCLFREPPDTETPVVSTQRADSKEQEKKRDKKKKWQDKKRSLHLLNMVVSALFRLDPRASPSIGPCRSCKSLVPCLEPLQPIASSPLNPPAADGRSAHGQTSISFNAVSLSRCLLAYCFFIRSSLIPCLHEFSIVFFFSGHAPA